MDRLSFVAHVSLALCLTGSSACKDKPTGGNVATLSRVNAVRANPTWRDAMSEFCDVRYSQDHAPSFSLPRLASEPAPDLHEWRWVNVWATWCRPCIEELPMLRRWSGQLARGGRKFVLQLISVDESDAAVSEFRARHPDVPDSARVADPRALATWLRTLGLDESAPIPIHVLVDSAGRTRCVRAGGVGEADFPTIQRLLTE